MADTVWSIRYRDSDQIPTTHRPELTKRTMRDRQLNRQILCIELPWEVVGVELKLEAGEIDVQLLHASDATWCCAECGKACSLHDHQPERVWRHSVPNSMSTCE